MLSPRLPRRRLGAFTLVELLTVMAIIAILMGILFPTIGAAIQTAKKAQAKNDEIQLVSAIKAFYTEYGKYPLTATQTGDTEIKNTDLATLLNELRVPAGYTPTMNPRKLNFIEVPDAKNLNQANKEKGGIGGASGGKAGQWLDPWGNTYVVWIDGNYDNAIINPYDTTAGSATLSTGVLVYSIGRDSTKATTFKGSDDVISWQ